MSDLNEMMCEYGFSTRIKNAINNHAKELGINSFADLRRLVKEKPEEILAIPNLSKVSYYQMKDAFYDKHISYEGIPSAKMLYDMPNDIDEAHEMGFAIGHMVSAAYWMVRQDKKQSAFTMIKAMDIILTREGYISE